MRFDINHRSDCGPRFAGRSRGFSFGPGGFHFDFGDEGGDWGGGRRGRRDRKRMFEGGELRLVLEGHAAQVFSAAFSPDGRWVTTASADGTARIWDVATGELSSVLSGHDGDVYCAAFSPDGQMVVTASRDATARLWSTAGASLHELKGHDSQITYAAWASDGRSVGSWHGPPGDR